MEGKILRDFIERQKKPKTVIANDLKMTRGNLYQYFDNKTLEPETKRKFEDYFKTEIFSNEVLRLQEPEALYLTREDQILNMLEEISTNLNETRHAAELNQALVKTILNQSARLEALATKAPLRSVLQRLNEASEEIFLKMHPELTQTSDG